MLVAFSIHALPLRRSTEPALLVWPQALVSPRSSHPVRSRCWWCRGIVLLHRDPWPRENDVERGDEGGELTEVSGPEKTPCGKAATLGRPDSGGVLTVRGESNQRSSSVCGVGATDRLPRGRRPSVRAWMTGRHWGNSGRDPLL